MIYQAPFGTETLNREIQHSNFKAELNQAMNLLDSDDDSQSGHKLAEKVYADGELLGLLISALFSKEKETEESFFDRHITSIQKVANDGSRLAQYCLAVYYETGELLEHDESKAFQYYNLSANAGLPESQHLYGIMRIYGTGGAEKNEQDGLTLVQSAIEAGLSDAKEFLEFYKNHND